ncbi:DUF4062 domain-containing protein [bacterium C-53]|nr:DUF4062 domain-containing protein [Lachnospiraceae bacterium]NBI04983.1 DUF4062 domain-containing protein [Lachnospiraceae bacterium]RKJ07503.1 DUF4062 domain-containing protein [bacterium C-53]
MNKKLQVFVSSTYTDLIEERQTAVQAILDAGHIPAGMELFKAGNESQLNTIYKWIDESDVYMLILGGRYGSIESISNKSYTQLEYEYALNKGIPVFAVVLSESFLTNKINSIGLSDVMEQKAPDKYQTFKSLVMSKIIRMVDDCKDIKIAIHSTLNEFLNEYDLTGWVHNSNENNIIQLLKENANLLKENNSLNKQVQKLQEQLNAKSKEQFGHYTFDELVDILKNKIFYEAFPQLNINAFDFFIDNYKSFSSITGYAESCDYEKCKFLEAYNLVEVEAIQMLRGTEYYQFKTSKQGIIFYTLLQKQNAKNNTFE